MAITYIDGQCPEHSEYAADQCPWSYCLAYRIVRAAISHAQLKAEAEAWRETIETHGMHLIMEAFPNAEVVSESTH